MATPQEIEKTVLSAGTDASRPAGYIQPELAALVGQRMAGCTIVDTIGSGAMGAVFRAIEHGVGNREVALKVLLPRWADEPEFLARFHKEAASAGGLNNDHVVKIFRHGQERGLPYLVMELVDGGTLLGLARKGGVQPLEAVRLLRQACEGLYDAERHRLVHQDVKPANIMLAERRLGTGARQRSRADVKIVDFGVARATEASDSTQTRAFAGTVLYASPEQLACARLDHRSDMYSLGATFYEVLVGKAAARGTTLDEVTEWTLATQRLSPRGERPEIPAELNTIIERMTALKPGDRYASFADVIDAVTALEERWRSRDVFRRTVRWTLGIAAVALVALAAFFYARDRRDASRRAEAARDAVLGVLADLGPAGRTAKLDANLRACATQLAACGVALPELGAKYVSSRKTPARCGQPCRGSRTTPNAPSPTGHGSSRRPSPRAGSSHRWSPRSSARAKRRPKRLPWPPRCGGSRPSWPSRPATSRGWPSTSAPRPKTWITATCSPLSWRRDEVCSSASRRCRGRVPSATPSSTRGSEASKKPVAKSFDGCATPSRRGRRRMA